MSIVHRSNRVETRFLLLGLMAVLATVSRGWAADPAPKSENPPKKTVRLLTIGNSFSGNATKYLPDLVKAGRHELIHRSVSVGGASMEIHWSKVEAHEKDPRDPVGSVCLEAGTEEGTQILQLGLCDHPASQHQES